jgi:hypothetical protein
LDDPLPQELSERSGSESQGASLPPPPAPLAVPATETYRDRSTGLVVFGIIQIILGLFAFLMIPLALFGALMARRAGGGMPASTTMLSVMTYTLAAIGLLTLGIGSIRARRWAWTLTLTLSWIWLVLGTVGTVMATAMLPRAFLAAFKTASAANSNAPPMPSAVMAVVLTLIIAVCAFIMVVLPIIFVVFYRGPNVEQTVKHRDPAERWTDHCPVPVLALSVLFFGGSVYSLLMSFTTPVFPLFGRYLTGLPGGTCFLLLAGFDGLAAYSLFRLRTTWWWITLAALAVRWASVIVTFRYGDLVKAYGKIGWSQQQLQMLSANPMLNSRMTVYGSAASGLLALGYMIWVKRYFAPKAAPGAEAIVSMPSI